MVRNGINKQKFKLYNYLLAMNRDPIRLKRKFNVKVYVRETYV